MDAFRYGLALVILMLLPGALLFWYSLHPFIRVWRRLGPRLTYLFHSGLLLAVALGVYRWRESLLHTGYGANLWLIALAVPVYAAATIVAKRRGSRLGMKVLLGMPEVAPRTHPATLITTGIYGRIRHPRYLELLLFLLGHALVVNYLAVYLALAAAGPLLLGIIHLEECELRDRFGSEYEAYCRRVPRLLPRWQVVRG
jgi:protein-S-isoprenylcysteine O-methyltransferase Ste14